MTTALRSTPRQRRLAYYLIAHDLTRVLLAAQLYVSMLKPEELQMFLAQLIYFSTPNGVGDTDIREICDQSLANNALDNITGALLYNGSYFIQLLEGGRTAISKCYHRICNDTRHKDVTLVDVSLIVERKFPDWNLRYIGASSLDVLLINRYFPSGFNPSVIVDPSALRDFLWFASQ